MKRYGQTIRLKDDPAVIARYVEYHAAVWPEVEHGLKSIGIQRMLIFLLGRQLFMYMETKDEFEPERDFPRYEASIARIKEWQDLMASMQEPVPDAQPGEWWARMKLVFALE
ncbi:MAG TPA: L-rhamnose mutarotase [Candidatus Binataceae bacterium]|nr:L-rhamnose mutarotase [Candidatus Binataceae bacterium]